HEFAHRSWTATGPGSKSGPSSATPLYLRCAGALAFGGTALRAFGRLASLLCRPPGRGSAGQMLDDRAGHADNLREAIEQFFPGLSRVPGTIELSTAGPEVDTHWVERVCHHPIAQDGLIGALLRQTPR